MKIKSLILILLIMFLFFGTAGFVLANCNCECQDGSTRTVSNKSECDSFCDQKSVASKKCVEIKDPDTELDNPLGITSAPVVIGQIIKALLGIIGTISLIIFIYGGIFMLTAAGNTERVKKGQLTLVWASLGILIVFAAYAILKFVFSVVGL